MRFLLRQIPESRPNEHYRTTIYSVHLQEKVMFLSLTEWRHPNRFVQALARPAVAWECFSFASTSPSLLIELIQICDDAVHSEWIMSANFERLHSVLASSPRRVGSVSILISPHHNGTPSWRLERVIALREWLCGEITGMECQGDSGDWFSNHVRPPEAQAGQVWHLPADVNSVQSKA
ncbi:hypothetical protein CT19431_MP30379 [Cupriavidus taiwanensis]|nr:hypothetical protein CT19431_MP30379 [Cupriavidus taiwanensis]